MQTRDGRKTLSFNNEEVELITHENNRIIVNFKSGNELVLHGQSLKDFGELVDEVFSIG